MLSFIFSSQCWYVLLLSISIVSRYKQVLSITRKRNGNSFSSRETGQYSNTNPGDCLGQRQSVKSSGSTFNNNNTIHHRNVILVSAQVLLVLTLGLWTLKYFGLGLDNTFEIGINKIVHQGLYLYPSTGMQNNSKTTVSDNFQVNFFNKLTRVI